MKTKATCQHSDHQRHQDRHEARYQQSQSGCLQTFYEIGTRIQADNSDKPGKSDGFEYPKSRPWNASKEARLHGPEPAANESAEQHADTHAQSDLESAGPKCRNTDQSADYDSECDHNHIRRIGGPVGNTDRLGGRGDTV